MKAGLLALFVLAGCSSSLEPLDGDLYVLESISGLPLPAPYSPLGDVNSRIYADTISLASNGSGERRTLYDSFQGTKRFERAEFTYVRNANRVEIAFKCTDTANCVAPPHLSGDVSGSALAITESKITRLPLVFRRI